MRKKILPLCSSIASILVALGVVAPPASYAQGESYPWGVKRIGADIVHGYNKGATVKVAILDSGIGPHEDLSIAGGTNFHPHDPALPLDPDNYDDEEDGYGYGTALAGIVAALSNGIGVIGVAPEVELYAVRVLGWHGPVSLQNMIAGIYWSIDPNHKMDVICLGPQYAKVSGDYPDLHAACDAAWEAGCLLVAAAGHRGDRNGQGDSIEGVALYESVIAVGATDKRDKRWMAVSSWAGSPTGPKLELMAPGDEITSTLVGGGYGIVGPWGAYESGTSLAAAHVAGVAALVIASGIQDANGNGRINDEVRQRLAETADDLGDPGRDWQFGYGIVDADEAAPPGPANQPPAVIITSPADGSTHPSGTTILFEGTALDPEDGDLTSALTWTSSIDGQIGSGASFCRTLSNGIHTITASATDSKGAMGSDSHTITVGTLTKLNVAVSTDKTNYKVGERATIKVLVTDSVGNPVRGASVHVEVKAPKGKVYPYDGATDTYGVAWFWHETQRKDGTGTYRVNATASHPQYESGSASTTFNVSS